MTKIVTVIGARPQFIKASVVSAELARHDISEVVVHTGQHFDANMSDVFFAELEMGAPRYNLAIGGRGHGEMTGLMLAEVEKVLLKEVPSAVLVYGDTNSTLAGALASVKLGIPVAHVEAGLRSFNWRMPEEINRILTDRISRWLFAPTDMAVSHLRREGMDEAHIFSVGDVMYDVALQHGARVSGTGGAIDELGIAPGNYVLATIHRAENTDDHRRLDTIVNALVAISRKLPVVWPLHPRTRNALKLADVYEFAAQSLLLTEPVGYLEMVRLEKYAALIATDSGGVQKEAFFHRVPCVTLRDETEWIELVEAGWNRLASPNDPDAIRACMEAALGSHGLDVAPYGNGQVAEKIVGQLVQELAV